VIRGADERDRRRSPHACRTFVLCTNANPFAAAADRAKLQLLSAGHDVALNDAASFCRVGTDDKSAAHATLDLVAPSFAAQKALNARRVRQHKSWIACQGERGTSSRQEMSV
jgi:hypothetical protein